MGLTLSTWIIVSSVYLASCDQYQVSSLRLGRLSPGLLHSISTSSHDLCGKLDCLCMHQACTSTVSTTRT